MIDTSRFVGSRGFKSHLVYLILFVFVFIFGFYFIITFNFFSQGSDSEVLTH